MNIGENFRPSPHSRVLQFNGRRAWGAIACVFLSSVGVLAPRVERAVPRDALALSLPLPRRAEPSRGEVEKERSEDERPSRDSAEWHRYSEGGLAYPPFKW